MRIRKISNDRVTVHLNVRDLENFNLRPEEGPPKPSELHGFLFEVMELVKTETGFDPYDGGQVVVEAVNSADGMKLNICRLAADEPKKLTRRQFESCRGVRAKKTLGETGLSGTLTKEDLIELLRSLDVIVEKKKPTPKRVTFVFDSFSDLESALCLMDARAVRECVLYRSGERYAILARLKPACRTYNLLSEFAAISHGGDVLTADIRENWTEVAGKDKLVAMAEAMRSMK